MASASSIQTRTQHPDYGVDAPAVMRDLLLFGALALGLGLVLPSHISLGPVLFSNRTFLWTGGFLFAEGLFFLLYVKRIKFRHRDRMLRMVDWHGDEQVLDVGCGRGLLLAGAARRLTSGHATGIDIWSNVDMGGNSAASTTHNLELEGVLSRCTLVSAPAEQMPFADRQFNVILSNLCLHNIYDRPTRETALREISRVLAPGGIALISDYKRTAEYAHAFAAAGLRVERRWGHPLAFPPLRIVVARREP